MKDVIECQSCLWYYGSIGEQKEGQSAGAAFSVPRTNE